MQVGTDGRVACATCHFHAGADGRTKNQINPGPNGAFQAAGPNETLDPSDFPFHQRGGLVDFQASPVLRDWDDIGGSQGVRKATFGGVTPGAPADITIPEDDPVFQVGGVEVRQVTAVSAPSVINAIFNYSNLWDGAAKTIFNGVNTSGAADQNARIFVQTGSGLQPGIARIPDASVASQAVGPPLNSTEMSSIGRSFPDIGKKLLTLTPLGQQLVHVNDSVLGLLSRQRVTPGQPGLNTTYADMIKAAFHPQYWSNEDQIVTFSGGTPTISPRPAGSLGPGQYTQMEANFSLFFGLAVQLYEATLVSDDAPFDRVMAGLQPFSPIEERGFNLFIGAAGCAVCHAGSEFTTASQSNLVFNLGGPPLLVERMATGDPTIAPANYDDGYFNIGITRTTDDLGLGDVDSFGFPLSYSALGRMKHEGLLPPHLAEFVPDLPPNTIGAVRDAVNGTFKAPSLRNIELTAPYFHNGSVATLADVIRFYARGGNHPVDNVDDLDPNMIEIGALQGHPEEVGALVAFLRTLTDERVRNEQAPFDHPQLFVPNGATDANPAVDEVMEIPAVGAAGRTAQGLPPLGPFVATNTAPVVINDQFSVPMNSSNTLDVLGNDGDLDGQELTVVGVTPGASGSVSVGLDGITVTYAPAPGFSGLDTFEYTVSDGTLTATGRVDIAVLPEPNRAPEARLDFFLTVPADSVDVPLPVILNDFDQDGNPLWISSVVPPVAGTVRIDPLGDQLLYTPPTGFVGFVNISYTISDGALTSTNVATVKVNRAPTAVDDTVTVAANSAGSQLWVLNNDRDANVDDVLFLAAINQPAKGEAIVDPSGTYIIYTPDPGATGPDTITYVASDGFLVSFARIHITIAEGNAPPVAADDSFDVPPDSMNNQLMVLDNDYDPDGDNLVVASVTSAANGVASVGPGGAYVLYTPNAGFQGQDSFSYTVRDPSGAEATANVSVTVPPSGVQPNRPPELNNDAFFVDPDSTNTPLPVLNNDTDPDGDDIIIVSVTAAANGLASVGPGGLYLLYTPNPGFQGRDTFSYTARDMYGAESTATVTVDVLRAEEVYLPQIARQ
jgi:cytochrome c peroxidase